MNIRRLENIKIHKFRGLRDLELVDLGQINLLVGINNSGKTSVLEALNIYCHPLDARTWLSTARQRDLEAQQRTPTIDALKWLFVQDVSFDGGQLHKGTISISSGGIFSVKRMEAGYEQIEEIWVSDRRGKRIFFDSEEPILEDEDDSGIRKGLEIRIDLFTEQLSLLDSAPSLSKSFQLWEDRFLPLSTSGDRTQHSLPASMVTPSSHRSERLQIKLLSESLFQNFKHDVLHLLQELDSNISDIEILQQPETSLYRFGIFIQHDKLGLVPISTFGDGVRRLLHIALKLVSVRGGVLLVDEIESSIHTEALQSSFSWLARWCKEMDVQLFATTHSLEAVDAILEVTESSSDLVLYRLDPKQVQTRVVRHDWNRLKRLREELGQEVRW